MNTKWVGGAAGPFLHPGRNCWRVAAAERLAFLIDGEAYFDAFYRTALNAERSIIIVSWDIDTRVTLLRTQEDTKGCPVELGDFVQRLLVHKRGLQVYILNWDFAMIYAMERQWMPLLQFGWPSHPRLRFQLNDRHPVGASQHEKLVVIDDTVAFVGGLDLTKNRWDTSAHSGNEPRRTDPDGAIYPPFHDIHCMVGGEAAAALGGVARMRWHQATGCDLSIGQGRPVKDVWPSTVQPDLRNVQIAVARTQPHFEGQPEVREIERLYLDAIKQAQRFILLESQYFTSHSIGNALQARLAEPRGPEVVVITRQNSDGWLEHHTMDVLRARLVRRLRQAAQRDQFHVYCPTVPDLPEGQCIGVHSKLLLVDDAILTIGSANCSNRSLGLDTECNLVIDGTADDVVREGLSRFRHKLLAEHLGAEPAAIFQAEQQTGSLIGAINRFRGNPRTLCECLCEVDPEIDQLLPDMALADPERPVAPDDLWAMFFRSAGNRRAGKEIAMALAVLAIFCGLAAVWHWSPLREAITVPALLAALESLREWPDGVMVLLGSYAIGGMLGVPVTVLIVVTAMALGPVEGFVVALVGATIGAGLTFGLGRWVGRPLVRRIAGRRLNEVSRRLARRGILSVIALRIVPVAPFTVVNLVAGASRIRFVDFIVGTLLGMAPGISITVLVIDRVGQGIQEASWGTVTVLGLFVVVAWSGLVCGLRSRYSVGKARRGLRMSAGKVEA